MALVSDAIWAPAPSTTRGQPVPLSADPKGERIAYASNKSIFLRNIDNPAISRQYTDHICQTTVARFSPSGSYVASGDVSGKVRIWDCVGDGITKGEYSIIAGKINDIAWDGDSQRIIAVGEARGGRLGHCITWDSGNTVGEITGHGNQINCVSIRQQRPMRAATASDDRTTAFFHGVPFKFNTSLRDQHERFVYGTAFSPDGSTLVSVGADRRIWLYDGKTAEVRSQIGRDVHTGSIFAVSWAPDSKRLATASADQTVKVWDIEAGKAVQSWRMGDEGVNNISHQQYGVVWPNRKDGTIISVDLDGNLNYLKDGSSRPTRIISGHQKSITAEVISVESQTLFTGSYDGRICSWKLNEGIPETVTGDAHTNYIADLAAAPESNRVYSAAWDDTLRCISGDNSAFVGSAQSLAGQPKAMAVSRDGVVYTATSDAILIFKDGSQQIGRLPVTEATALGCQGDLLAVGHADKNVKIFSLAIPDKPQAISKSLRMANGPISRLTFSPHGKYLAVGSSDGKILVYATSDWSVVTDRWSAHTGRVTCFAWHKDEEFAVSGGLDTNLFVWSIKEPGRRIKAANAHKDGINGVVWEESGRILSAGGDAAIKVWKVEKL